MPVVKPLIKKPYPHTRCMECPIRERALFQAVAEGYVHNAQEHRTAQYLLAAKAELYREGDLSPLAYTLFDGWMLLYRSDPEGGRQGLRVALPGDFIGYHGATIGATGMSHAAVAITDVTLCGFHHADLHKMLHYYPPLAVKLAHIQSRDLDRCYTTILSLGRKSAEARIGHLILDVFHRLRARGAVQGHTMPFPLTQANLGELTGLTLVHTNRVIRRLCARGYIEWTRKDLALLDEPGLSRLVGFDARELERPAARPSL